MTYQFFDPAAPKYHDAAFYASRPVSDHIHEQGHRERLLRTLCDVGYLLDLQLGLQSVTDLGCGNGGFLYALSKRRPNLKAWGYDLSPLAVDFARHDYGVNAGLLDFVNETAKAEIGDIVVMTEVLEHLVDPPALLAKLTRRAKWIVVSCPAEENAERHYEYHLWAWEPADFKRMFEVLGYSVILHYNLVGTSSQFLVAKVPA